MDHRSFFSLGWYVNEFLQIISFFKRSWFKLRCGTVSGIVLCYTVVIKCVAFFTIFAKSKMTFTYTSLLFTLLFPNVVVVLGLSKNIGESKVLVKKRHRSADLHTPIHTSPPPLSFLYLMMLDFSLNDTKKLIHGTVTPYCDLYPAEPTVYF